MDDVRLLRITEVAELLKISRTKVYQLVATGEIPSLHVARSPSGAASTMSGYHGLASSRSPRCG